MLRRTVMLIVVSLVSTFFLISAASAADKFEYLSVKAALQSELAKEKLDPAISFYMKGQKHKKARNTSREYSANKRSRKFKRTVKQACDQAFISALMSFQDRAQRQGQNAVIDLYSFTKNKKYQNSEKYSCLVGGMMTNVVLKGKVADIK